MYKLLTDLDPSKSCGLNNISGILLKGGAPYLAAPLAKIVDASPSS